MIISENTVKDLEILNSFDNKAGIIDCFDNDLSKEAGSVLKKLFLNPASDYKIIKNRQKALKYIIKNLDSIEIRFKHGLLSSLSRYLETNIKTADLNNLAEKINFLYFSKNDYFYIESGVKLFFEFLNRLNEYLQLCQEENLPEIIHKILEKIRFLIFNEEITNIKQLKKKTDYLSADCIIRQRLKNQTQEIIEDIYFMETLVSIAKTIINYDLVFPDIKPNTTEILIKDLWHLFINEPVKNEFYLSSKKNLLLLTGANMSGKSTYLKASCIAVYLAHLGIGVPAKEMTSPLFQNIMTDITTTENIRLGYSYYFSEVKNVKEIFNELGNKKKCFVICDEIFKGTNIKDAFEASKIVIEGFLNCSSSFFIVSTHLTELSDKINSNKISYKCFKSTIKDGKIIYPFKLIDGISKERMGVEILKNEGILDMIENIKKAGGYNS